MKQKIQFYNEKLDIRKLRPIIRNHICGIEIPSISNSELEFIKMLEVANENHWAFKTNISNNKITDILNKSVIDAMIRKTIQDEFDFEFEIAHILKSEIKLRNLLKHFLYERHFYEDVLADNISELSAANPCAVNHITKIHKMQYINIILMHLIYEIDICLNRDVVHDYSIESIKAAYDTSDILKDKHLMRILAEFTEMIVTSRFVNLIKLQDILDITAIFDIICQICIKVATDCFKFLKSNHYCRTVYLELYDHMIIDVMNTLKTEKKIKKDLKEYKNTMRFIDALVFTQDMLEGNYTKVQYSTIPVLITRLLDKGLSLSDIGCSLENQGIVKRFTCIIKTEDKPMVTSTVYRLCNDLPVTLITEHLNLMIKKNK